MKFSTILGVLFLSVTIYNGTAYSSDIFYNAETKKILIKNVSDENFLIFEEASRGNSEVFFDYFNGQAALVHDNNSLVSYSSYSTIIYDGDGFKFDCVYVELKNNENGINSKNGICGLNKHISNKTVLSGEENSDVVKIITQRFSDINTSYFVHGEIERLPILLFQNETSYAYELYSSKEDFLKDKYSIVTCENKSNICTVYNDEPWFILSKMTQNTFLLKKSQHTNGEHHLVSARGISDNYKSSFMPFKVKKEKAFFYDDNSKKTKAYLIDGDRITLLSHGGELCKIMFLNNKNNAVVGSVMCSDLSLQ